MISEWKRRNIHDDSIMFTSGKKFIGVHKALGLYWIDYGIKGQHMLGTLKPARTMKDVLRRVEDAKKEFVLADKW
jgi:hypothetical protein